MSVLVPILCVLNMVVSILVLTVGICGLRMKVARLSLCVTNVGINVSRGEVMTNRSKCCNATVRVGGEGETHYYICNQCERECDVAKPSLPLVVAKWLHEMYEPKIDGNYIFEATAYLPDADSLLTLLSRHGVVQVDENQDFSPFAGIPINFKRVRPLEKPLAQTSEWQILHG